jgi:hypothetical protein
MTADAPQRPLQAPPKLASMRPPADPTLHAMAGNAHVLWRLAQQGNAPAPALDSGNPAEEFKNVCEFMRLYTTLRFYQLALLLGTTGSIIGALSSFAVRSNFARIEILKGGGLLISLALLVMELRATTYWTQLRRRANELAAVLRYEPFPHSASRWNPLTTGGAGFYLHALMATLWFASLFIRLESGL